MNRANRLINQLLTEQDETDDTKEDFNKYGIKELRDGLTIEEIKTKYSWLLKARMKDAVIGESQGYLVWYNGTWKGGIWLDGTWKSGAWYDGYWANGIWDNGTWIDGIWDNGIWESGTWRNGTWRDGTWISGIWKDGEWRGGKDGNGLYHKESPDKW